MSRYVLWALANVVVFAMAIGFMPLTHDDSLIALIFWIWPSALGFMAD